MLEEIREQYDFTYECILESLNALDELIQNKEDSAIVINDLDNFILRLKNENLYTVDLKKFIDEYIKFYNQWGEVDVKRRTKRNI